jgi:predicted flap endonuclease-1-like 5' DNA nuclease
MSRSTRTLIAAMLFVLAGFLILNNIVQSAPVGDWLLPVGLLVVGAVFLLYPEEAAAPAASVSDAEPMPTLAAAAAPKPVTPPPPAPVLDEPAPPAAVAPLAEDVPVTVSEPYVKEVGDAEPVPAAVVEQHPPTHAPVVDASASAAAGPDDLTIINGIGPKMQTALQASGFDSFAKIAAASPDELRAAVQAAGMRLAPTIDTWPEQARGLMK